MHRRITQAATVIMMLALIITGCTSQASNIGMAKDKTNNVVDTGFTVNTVGSYDSADTAVVVSVVPEDNAVTFMNLNADRQYTLYYDGTTYVTDKYNGPMSISQIQTGDVVNVNFLKGKRQIASIQQSPDAWVYDKITKYDLGGINKTASIGSSIYSLPDNVVVFSDDRRAEVMDIVSQDVITVHGVDHKIYSINVEKGHGYLRLKNDQALIGGWIEVGNAVIREITEDMLLVVPEGSYQVYLSNDGVSTVKDIIIERNKEVVLDVGDLEIAQDKTGRILISVTPEDAEVSIDGKEVDISAPIELAYGIHQVHLEAEGYDSLTKYIQVGSEYAKISFTLEEKKEPKEDDDNSSISWNDLWPDDSSISDNSISDNTISAVETNRVYIDAPKDVEVYVDGNYIGISPISFKKTVGSHTVTLRKTGYVTKSYTIYLYNDGEDITYSFTDLEKENTGNSNTNTNTPSKGSTNTPSSGSSTSTNNKGDVSGNIPPDNTPSGSPQSPSAGKGDGNEDEGDGTEGEGSGTEGEEDSTEGEGDGTEGEGDSTEGKGDSTENEESEDEEGDGEDGELTLIIEKLKRAIMKTEN